MRCISIPNKEGLVKFGKSCKKSEKLPSRDVPRKRYSENVQQIYRRTPMSKCDFNKVALQLY